MHWKQNVNKAVIMIAVLIISLSVTNIFASAQEPDVRKLAFLRIEIPEFRQVYYQTQGRWPEGLKIEIAIHKSEAPFNLYTLAYPKRAAAVAKKARESGIPPEDIADLDCEDPLITEVDGVTRTYKFFYWFNNEWRNYGNFYPGEIARIALWPGRYTIIFNIVSGQGGSLAGLLRDVKLNLTPGQFDVNSE